jgi:hypothetical protein
VPKKPKKEFLEKTKELLQKRLDESAKVVQTKQSDWDKYRDWYRGDIKQREHQWESNLVIPKPFYIVQTVTPQILSAIFGTADFLTIKNPRVDSTTLTRLGKWFVWFMLRKMGFYMRALELFMDAPVVGTSFLKLYSRNGMPSIDFLKADDFYPDPRCRKPGDVDSMQFCFHRFRREFGELERAKVHRMEEVDVEIPVDIDLEGNPILQSISIPQLVEDDLYFNLDEVWEKHLKEADTETADEELKLDIPTLDLMEHWGEIETTFGVYDVSRSVYKPGTYEEYVVTGVVEGLDTNTPTIETIIRCEPSTFSYMDQIEQREKFLKPFVSSTYSVLPGEFYGMGAIQPVESLIAEMKEHHDLYLDEHKRSVMSILSVLERSGLTERDLPFTPYAHWVMRNHEDVQVIKFPEVNLQAFQFVHGLIDREIDRTAGSSTMMQGVATTKRQTLGEVQSLMMEASRRFTTFIQMSDHMTLRPTAFKTLILMKSMPAILQGQPFVLPDDEITVDPNLLSEEMEFAFAASGVEPEYSKYAKQDMFPRLLRELLGIAEASGGQYVPDAVEIMEEVEQLYNFSNFKRFFKEARPSVPVDALMAGAEEAQIPPEVIQRAIEGAQMLMQMEEEQSKRQ